MRPSYMSYPIQVRGRGSHLERERDMGLQDLHDTTLVLGLGFNPKRDDQPPATNNTSSFHSSGSVEPALTLGRQSSSSHSTVSSHSDVDKRERSMDGSDGKEVDEEDGCNKKKLRLTKEQSVLLEDRFKEHSSLNPKQKAALAKQLNLRPRQVEVWFQNRRARTKLKQTEVDCEFLRRCCEMLTEENRRLQNEVKELKSITLPPPFYVQPIPTTAVAVGVCPYCQRIAGPHDHNNTNSTKVDDKSFTTSQPTSC